MIISKSKTPLVSVILPTFNRAYCLKRCLDSVLAQTTNDWELIIVDDGSTDETLNLVEKYIASDSRFLIIKRQNQGLPLSLNTGILLARGNYITFINSDDYYKNTHLANRIDAMQAKPEIDILHGGCEIIGDPFVVDKYDPKKRIHLKDCPIGGTFFGKRAVFFELDGFANMAYSEDSDFMARAEKKFRTIKISEPNTYVYDRTFSDSICNQKLVTSSAQQ